MSTIVTRLQIKNLGCTKDIDVALDDPLLLFYGKRRQGKSTILNAVRLLAGGSFPPDLLRHGEKDGLTCLTTTDGSVSRTFYRGKDGATKARPIDYIVDGKPVRGNVVKQIADLFNPFLLNDRYFIDMREKEKQEYLLTLLNVNTADVDNEIVRREARAKELRSEIKAFGTITPVPVEPVDEVALVAAREEIVQQHAKEQKTVENSNQVAQNHNSTRDRGVRAFAANKEDVSAIENEIKEIQKKLEDAENRLMVAVKAQDKTARWLDDQANAVKPLADLPPAPDTSALDASISNAKATAVRYEIYQGELNKAKERDAKSAELSAETKAIKTAGDERRAKLTEASGSCPITDLTVNEEGEILYQGTTMAMISDSQEMELTGRLQGQFPEGLGIQLVDRAESMGEDICDLVDLAKDQKRTILAAVVGNKPAIVPDDVGVFIVEQGAVKDDDMLQ